MGMRSACAPQTVVLVMALVLATLVGPSGADVSAQPREYGGEPVRFAAGANTLAGTLFLPRVRHTVPAVVVVNGSGESSYKRDFWRGGHFWTGITQQLLGMGIAVVHYDKPGIGESSGDWRNESFDDRTANAMAALRFLRSRQEIDPERIGLLGYSQGGYVAYLAASRHPKDVSFVVSLAGPAVSVRRQIADDRRYHWECSGAPATEVRMAGLSIFLGLHTILSYVAPVSYLSKIVRFDPAPVLQNIDVPTLALFAEHDPYVPIRPNVRELAQHFADPSLLTMHVIPNSDHSFRTSDGCPRGYVWTDFADGFSRAFRNPRFWRQALERRPAIDSPQAAAP